MRKHTGSLACQRGVAVITALLLTTLAITIVASLFWQQQVQVRSIENQRLQLQKQWILRGALDWAGLILREDAKYSRFGAVDTLDEPWAVPLAETRLDQYVENGRVDTDAADASLSGIILDAQSRYNLTNLCDGGNINRNEVAVFERLLTGAQLDPALAQATASLMAASQGGSVATASNAGDSRPMKFEQVNDLLAVPGFSIEAIDKLKEFVIVLPRATQINVNTASAEVLAAKIEALSLTDAAAVVANRKTASFQNVGRFATDAVPGRTLPTSGLDVKTSYFLVLGKVRMSRAGLEVQALIERQGARTTLIWIREN
jgi:general secretion pathway protein K